MKKVARARAYASLHCSDGLKDESIELQQDPEGGQRVHEFVEPLYAKAPYPLAAGAVFRRLEALIGLHCGGISGGGGG